MNPSRINTLEPAFDKLLKDLAKLEKIGKIITIEIELTDANDVYDRLETIFQDSGGVFMSLHTMFVNYAELEYRGIETILDRLYHTTAESEIIDGMLIQMRLQTRTGPIDISVEIDEKSDLPRIISVSDQQNYFDIVTMLRYLWYTRS